MRNLYSLLSQGAVFGFAFLIFLVLVRQLDVATFGTWVLYQTVMTFAEMARMGFIQNGLVKFLTDHPDERKAIVGAAWLLNLGSGLLLWLLLWGLSYPLAELWEAPLLTELTFAYGLVALTWGGFRFVEYLLVADRDFRMVFFGHMVNGSLYAGSVLALALSGRLDTPVQVLFCQSVAALLALGGLMLVRSALLRMSRPRRHWLVKLAQYGRYTMGSSLGSVLMQRLDVLMLGYFLGPASVALYNIGTKLTNYLEIPLRAVTLVIFPQLSKVFGEQGSEAFARLWERSVSQLLAMVLPPCIVLWLLASPAIEWMAGEGYTEAAPVLQIFLLVALLKPWGRLAGVSLDAIGDPRANFRLVWLSLVLNGGWNALFIPWLGVIGAAWATVISMAVTTAVGVWTLCRQTPLQIGRPVRALPQVYRRGWQNVRAKLVHRKLAVVPEREPGRDG